MGETTLVVEGDPGPLGAVLGMHAHFHTARAVALGKEHAAADGVGVRNMGTHGCCAADGAEQRERGGAHYSVGRPLATHALVPPSTFTVWKPCFANAAGTSVKAGGECDPEPPQDTFCFTDANCGDGQVCNHDECHNPCPPDAVCIAACMGICEDAPPPPPSGTRRSNASRHAQTGSHR